MNTQDSFEPAQRAILEVLYVKFGSTADSEKIATLERELGGDKKYNYYSSSGSIDESDKLQYLEYEYLESVGALIPDLV